MPSDWKKAGPRIRDARLLQRLRSQARECALCGVPPPLDPHHVYPRGQGGGDVAQNICMLCPECHRRITVNEEVVRTLLGEHLLAARWDVIDYIIERLGDEPGREWLQRRLFLENV